GRAARRARSRARAVVADRAARRAAGARRAGPRRRGSDRRRTTAGSPSFGRSALRDRARARAQRSAHAARSARARARPRRAARRRHWRAETGDAGEAVAAFAARARMTPGNLRRVARLARANASVARRTTIQPDDLRDASRALHGRLLDTLAERVDTIGGWAR